MRPTPEALRAFQDRLTEKQTLQAHGVPVPTFAPIDPQNPRTALEVVGLPAVIKHAPLLATMAKGRRL